MIDIKQTNSETKGFFTATENGKKAGVMTYSWAGKKKFIIDHTEVEPEYNGKGVGKQLVNAAVDFARKENKKITPVCTFAKAMFDKNEDWNDVLS